MSIRRRVCCIRYAMRESIRYRWRNRILEIAHLTFCRLQLLAQRYLKLLKSALFL
jgi:hypothetical protein